MCMLRLPVITETYDACQADSIHVWHKVCGGRSLVFILAVVLDCRFDVSTYNSAILEHHSPFDKLVEIDLVFTLGLWIARGLCRTDPLFFATKLGAENGRRVRRHLAASLAKVSGSCLRCLSSRASSGRCRVPSCRVAADALPTEVCTTARSFIGETSSCVGVRLWKAGVEGSRWTSAFVRNSLGAWLPMFGAMLLQGS
jgi:hypothetical protein